MYVNKNHVKIVQTISSIRKNVKKSNIFFKMYPVGIETKIVNNYFTFGAKTFRDTWNRESGNLQTLYLNECGS